MKVVILAGGLGTRLAEETDVKPKPMVEIGSMPILWHIMKIYDSYGFKDFIICLGYKGNLIKEFFQNYMLYSSDVTFDLERGNYSIHNWRSEPWKVTLVDTGRHTMTGGRLLRIKDYLSENEDFMLTYGDGVASIDITKLLQFHKKQGRLATLTSVAPPGRFGAISVNENSFVTDFSEKPSGKEARVNGGFFVLNYKVLSLIRDENVMWEGEPLEGLAKANELSAFRHDGFWLPMDTLRDKYELESLWNSGSAPWKTWSG